MALVVDAGVGSTVRVVLAFGLPTELPFIQVRTHHALSLEAGVGGAI